MNPGKLNQKIKIYEPDSSYDDYGESVATKMLVHSCWASVKNKSGREQFAAATPYAKTVTSFLIRYTRTAIDTTMTVDFKGEEYNVVLVDNYNFSNKYIEITAEKVL